MKWHVAVLCVAVLVGDFAWPQHRASTQGPVSQYGKCNFLPSDAETIPGLSCTLFWAAPARVTAFFHYPEQFKAFHSAKIHDDNEDQKRPAESDILSFFLMSLPCHMKGLSRAKKSPASTT